MSKLENWLTGISTADYSTENFKRFLDCGVKCCEISYGVYEEALKIDWKALDKNAKETGIILWSYHLPFYPPTDIADLDKEKRAFAVKEDIELIKKAANCGMGKMIIHASYEPITAEERAEKMKCSKEALAILAEAAAKEGAIVCVEDLPRSCLGHDAKEVKELISADERLRVCFDVNHLLITSGCTHKDFVDALGDKIVTTHMSDYDFIDEKHFFCGNGDIDWKELVESLENADYNGPFMYEGGFAPHRVRKEVPFGKIEDAHERHLTIKNYRGKNK